MNVNRDTFGTVISINVCVQSHEFVIDELYLVKALNVDSAMLDLPKFNGYVTPTRDYMLHCLNFKASLILAADQLVPAQMFDKLVRIGLEFLIAQSQLLGKLLKHNIMSARNDRMLTAFDLGLIKVYYY